MVVAFDIPSTVDVLLIDHDMDDVRAIRDSFVAAKVAIRLHVATDGTGALEFLRENDTAPTPDILLLSDNLPSSQYCMIAAALEKHREFTTLLVTDAAVEGAEMNTNELTVDGRLSKPLDPDAFVRMVRTFEGYGVSIVRAPHDHSSPASPR